MKFRIVVAMLLTMLAGCSDPKSYEVSKLNEEQQKEIGKKLNAEEGAKLTAYMMRNALSGKSLPTGVTVGQAIKDQDEWLAKQKAEEAKAAEIKKRVDAERKAKLEEFAKLVSVALVGKKNSYEQYERRFVGLHIAYENKTDKDMVGVKGVLRITDIFGDKILNIRWSYDEGIPANSTRVERGSGLRVNQFMDEHMKLWNSDFEKLKATFEVQTVIFKDGTKVDAPE